MSDTPRGTRAPGPVMQTLSRPIRLFPPGLQRPTAAELIAGADLPAPLADLASRAVKRAGLWQSERLDVARELVAHFKDGIECGATADELARSFGDPLHAAKLIGRAKRRSRPPAWRALAATARALALLLGLVLAVFLFFAGRAYLSHPTIAHNYLAELNAPIAAIPESDRAWPLYRGAFLALPRMPSDIAKDFPALEPGDERWPAAVAYLDQCSETLGLLRRVAARSRLGRPLSTTTDDVELEAHVRYLSGVDPDRARADALADTATLPADANPELIGVLLPHLGQGRTLARLLSFDARVAAASGDGARVASDLEAMYAIAGHMRDNGFLIGSLVSLAVHSLAGETLGRVLAERPDVLSDSQLASLAHAATRLPMKPDFDGERLGMDDLLQRTYSDDGDGDGHLTAEGVRQMDRYMAVAGSAVPSPIREGVQAPLVSAVSVSRRALRDRYTRMLADTLAYGAISPWLRPDSSPDEEVARLAESFDGKRYLLISILMPALNRSVWAHDEAAQRRDGTLVAIALELHRRATGACPATLADISTAVLPEVPRDMFDGAPLRYALRGGVPVVYSIGVDRKDDGGRPPSGSLGRAGRWLSRAEAAAALGSSEAASIDGDWILWPPAPVKPAPSRN